VRPLTGGKLQAGLVCRERANKKKEKIVKYIEASALPVRNGTRKVKRKTAQEATAAKSQKGQKRREALGMHSHLHAISGTHSNIKSHVLDHHLNAH